MEDLRSLHKDNIFVSYYQRPPSSSTARSGKEDWEDWSDSEPLSPAKEGVVLEIVNDGSPPALKRAQQAPARKSSWVLHGTRQSVPRPTRLKSRGRQRAQNAKAGIRLVTDMTSFRKQQHIAQQLKQLSAEADSRRGRFADIAALQALEGDQSQSSVGSLHWLKKKPSTASPHKAKASQNPGPGLRQSDLSPDDRPIMIGFTVSDDLATRMDTPMSTTRPDAAHPVRQQQQRQQQQQVQSFWSPDTEDSGQSPFRTTSRAASSVYSQNGTLFDFNAPPVPAVPSTFRDKQAQWTESPSMAEADDDDDFTPVTLFEEDGRSPVATRTKSKGHEKSPGTAGTSAKGWWDCMDTPFLGQHSQDRFEAQPPKPQPGGGPMPQPVAGQSTNNPFHGINLKSKLSKEPDKPLEDDWYGGKGVKRAASPTPALKLADKSPVAVVNTKANSSLWDLSPTIASSSIATPMQARVAMRQLDSRSRDSSLNGFQHQATGASTVPTAVTSAAAALAGSTQSHSEKARILEEENERHTTAAGELPPPYSPPEKQAAKVRYQAVFPPGHAQGSQFPPSPGPESPGLARTMTSQGGIRMTEVPLAPPAARLAPGGRMTPPSEAYGDIALPDRAQGTFVPGNYYGPAIGNSPAARMERRRRRHEKEDALAHKVGGFWRGRGCFPEAGCFGRMGREGRRKRRIWLCVIALIVLAAVLVPVLVLVVLRKPAAAGPEGPSIWLNLTDFPPIPTGVLTVAGSENPEEVQTCVQPATMWSCQLPKEQAAANEPYPASGPLFVLQIQFDNSTRQFWDVPDGKAPTPTPLPPAKAFQTAQTQPVGLLTKMPMNIPSSVTEAPINAPVATTGDSTPSVSPTTPLHTGSSGTGSKDMAQKEDDKKKILPDMRRAEPPSRVDDLLRRADAAFSNPGFTPSPDPPSFQEMWFLGNTTDFIKADRKAGEATPFFISFLPSLNSTPVGPNAVPAPRSSSSASRRSVGDQFRRDVGQNLSAGGFMEGRLPAPPLNADGTAAPARLFPHPVQQPLRLYDRGLETEHYGFYTYFNKSIFLKSIGPLDNETFREGDVPADTKGGARRTEASFIAYWAWTRFHVQIWTRRGGLAKLNRADLSGARAGTAEEPMSPEQLLQVRRPGTFPYPITVREDTHGGEPTQKGTYSFAVDVRQKIDLEKFSLHLNSMDITTELINSRANFNPSFGGMDGGHGGCKCAWTNFVEVSGSGLPGGSGGRS